MKLYCYAENTSMAAEIFCGTDKQAEQRADDLWVFGDDSEEELTRMAWQVNRSDSHYMRRCGQNVLAYLDTWEECVECTCGVDRENEGGQCGGCGTVYCSHHKIALGENDTCRECGDE